MTMNDTMLIYKLKSVYQHLMISLLLILVYVSISFLVINEINSIFYIIPIVLLFILVNLVLNAYHTNKLVLIIFLAFVFLILFANLTTKKEDQHLKFIFDMNSSATNEASNYESILSYLSEKKNRLTSQLIFNATIKSSISINSLTAEKNDNNYNIFFVETNLEHAYLTSKQICAIESAAFHNPNANVYIVSLRAVVKQASLFKTYRNIIWLRLVPSELFQDTPLLKWWMKGQVLNSKFRIAHLSDAVRLAILWKYGGFYSDLDTITIKSFEHILGYNGAGFLNGKAPSLANGFLQFQARHPFIEKVMLRFAKDYNPLIWGYNGPILLRRIMQSFCNVKDIYTSLLLTPSNLNNKCKVHVYPQEYFYPYNNHQLEYLFKESVLNISAFKNTYSVHFFGKVSANNKVRHQDSNVYQHFASSNCEVIYNELHRTNRTFT